MSVVVFSYMDGILPNMLSAEPFPPQEFMANATVQMNIRLFTFHMIEVFFHELFSFPVDRYIFYFKSFKRYVSNLISLMILAFLLTPFSRISHFTGISPGHRDTCRAYGFSTDREFIASEFVHVPLIVPCTASTPVQIGFLRLGVGHQEID